MSERSADRDSGADTGRRRVKYAEAGQAMRDVHARARAANLNGFQWRVLSAVLDLTVSYSRLGDRFYLGQLAATVYSVERSARWQRDEVGKALAVLGEKVIEIEGPPRGRPKVGDDRRYTVRLNAGRSTRNKAENAGQSTDEMQGGRPATSREVITEKAKSSPRRKHSGRRSAPTPKKRSSNDWRAEDRELFGKVCADVEVDDDLDELYGVLQKNGIDWPGWLIAGMHERNELYGYLAAHGDLRELRGARDKLKMLPWSQRLAQTTER